ncbi:MAG: hypothetical protein GY859_12560, partial [Desulfobacterales bacterium]|nr:hypothetical protein [Desulfobacterales bacterium]
SVWSYKGSPVHQRDFQIDVLARAKSGDEYSLIGEVKNRKAKFSIREAAEFLEKAGELKELEGVNKVILIVFSFGGFYKNTIQYLEKRVVAWTEDPRWLER